MELQTPQAADMTWKRAGSSPVGLQVTRTRRRQAWKAKPTTRTENGSLFYLSFTINTFELTSSDQNYLCVFLALNCKSTQFLSLYFVLYGTHLLQFFYSSIYLTFYL